MKLPALRSRRPADGEPPRRPPAPWQRLRVPRPTDLRGIIQQNPGLKLISLLLAALLHFGSTLLGGRGSMQGALNIVAWASLPFALGVLR